MRRPRLQKAHSASRLQQSDVDCYAQLSIATTRRYRGTIYRAPSSATRSTVVQIPYANTHPPFVLYWKSSTQDTTSTDAMSQLHFAQSMCSGPPILRAMIRRSSGTSTNRGRQSKTRDTTGVEQFHKGRWSPGCGPSKWTFHT